VKPVSDGVGGKRRRIAIDEVKLREALDKGWKRETHITGVGRGGIKGEVVYTSPCGRPFKHYSDLVKVRIPYFYLTIIYYRFCSCFWGIRLIISIG
jgi:hypothetical protein